MASFVEVENRGGVAAIGGGKEEGKLKLATKSGVYLFKNTSDNHQLGPLLLHGHLTSLCA